MDNGSIRISIQQHHPKVRDSSNLSVIHNNPEYWYDHILFIVVFQAHCRLGNFWDSI
jgi:hypothetical protein